jgi:hypothetical protein
LGRKWGERRFRKLGIHRFYHRNLKSRSSIKPRKVKKMGGGGKCPKTIHIYLEYCAMKKMGRKIQFIIWMGRSYLVHFLTHSINFRLLDLRFLCFAPKERSVGRPRRNFFVSCWFLKLNLSRKLKEKRASESMLQKGTSMSLCVMKWIHTILL